MTRDDFRLRDSRDWDEVVALSKPQRLTNAIGYNAPAVFESVMFSTASVAGCESA